jgi:hypothetical protein
LQRIKGSNAGKEEKVRRNENSASKEQRKG